MEIALGTKDNIDGILALQTQVYRVNSIPDNAKTLLEELIDSKSYDVLVAKEEDLVVGSTFIFYFPIPAHGKPYALLEGLVVNKKSRGQGIGTDLIKKAVELARQKGCYKMIFTSGFDRQEFHGFYEKQGFKKTGYEFRMDL